LYAVNASTIGCGGTPAAATDIVVPEPISILQIPKKSFFVSRLGVPQPTLDLQDLDKRGRKILYGFQNQPEKILRKIFLK
jgi:hypothetical protein